MKYILLLLSICTGTAWANPQTPPSALYEEWRKSPAPADGSTAMTNPPSLQWASVKHWENRDVLYRVELSNDPNFPNGQTQRGQPQRWCFYNPHARLATGKWYWRYEVLDANCRVTHGPYSFEIRPETPVFETPSFAELLRSIPKGHPLVITQGRNLADLRKSAGNNPLVADIIQQGKKAISLEIYDGPLSDKDPAKERSLDRKASAEVRIFQNLLEAYVLCGDKGMLQAMLKRINVQLKWPTNDLLGSQVLTTLSNAYDALYEELPPDVRTRMAGVIERQLQKGLSAWPGKIEGRQVENHFWQMELAGNFTAALATVHDIDASRSMLEYTYELYLARFPNLATADGGWAEGLGYFGVNKSAIIDMPLLLKNICKVDAFKMPWYRSLADYFIYFAPTGGRIDGFGDMHDRVGNGDIGQAMMLVIGQENHDERATFRAAPSTKGSRAFDPWYQIVSGTVFDPAAAPRPADLPQSKMFPGVGLAALHTSVLDASHDTAVYFRSSPFGAKGHMHANQNAFNLSRGGEALFYSTGYYTSFADPHSLSSYRHTRAHNTILVNGCGQAFGHEGYGWIKRFADGNEMAYVCGDATMAYRPTVDEQFLGLLAESKIAPTPENGYGDGKLKLFERHVLLIRPDTLVVYDVLDSQISSSWTLLLHTMKKPVLTQEGLLELATGKHFASAFVTGSQPLVRSLTDEFHTPPADFKKKYKDTPRQYHVSYAAAQKSPGMRFLTIIQTGDSAEQIAPVASGGDGSFTVGQTVIQAELDPLRPARLSAKRQRSQLFINAVPSEVFGKAVSVPAGPCTLLAEKHGDNVKVILSENQPPVH